MKRYSRLFVQITVIFLVYYILSGLINGYLILAIFFTVTMLFIAYGYSGRKNYTFYLDSVCDVDKYLNFVNAKIKTKNESLYLLYLSYGNLYNGIFDDIENNLSKIDKSRLNIRERFMFEEIKLKLLYNDKDIEGYEKKLDEMSNGEFKRSQRNGLIILEAPLHLLKEEYSELVDLMFIIIPKQRQSYRVIELEYYLSLAYLALDKADDALAILEFITKRDLKLDQVVKARDLLNNLKEN